MKMHYPDFFPAAADDDWAEAAALSENEAGSGVGGVLNEDKSSELVGAGFDVLHDYYGDESVKADSAEGNIPPEGAAGADPVHQEDAAAGVADGAGGSPDEKEGTEAPGGEEAEAPDGGGSLAGGEEGAGSSSSSGGRLVEGEGEESPAGESSGEGESSGTDAPASGNFPEPEAEPASEAGSGQQPESEHEGPSVDVSLDDGSIGAFSESAPESEAPAFEAAEYESVYASEAFAPREELLQIHADLQVIACFLVVFLLIILCQHAYRFFKIFF